MNRDDARRAEEVLRAAPAFAAAGADAMAELVAAAQMLHLVEGEYLFRRGESSDAVYLVVEGELDVHLPDSTKAGEPFARLGPGELVGETQIVTGGGRTGDVRARGRAELVRVSRDGIDRAVEKEPTALDRVVKVVRGRLQHVQAHKALRRLFNVPGQEAIDALAARAD